MGLGDIVGMIIVLAAATWLLYRSLWKKKGHCHGCGDHGCCSRK